MLKALELSGFKSFADRTRFEFPTGICVVVGPNGSGKSNVVDAVKWVLGSQSAKSLRGKEMTDVIFNGCATRSPLGTSEVTLTLDNSQGRLPIEAGEVYVTRRVYRSGEGEYLINRQPCRLRDIKEILVGTGITTEAYCIIEQGKVDALLQSSPKDRRVIFEEAAGISQFKSKKALAARRMERVEQNLLRLSDIVDEVESRLRAVRMQAGKARRYRECTQRLQQLRTEVGLVDWRALTRQIASREWQYAELRQRLATAHESLAHAEQEAQQAETAAEVGLGRLRELEAALSNAREQIAAREALVEHGAVRHIELEKEIAAARAQLGDLSINGSASTSKYRDALSHLRDAEQELDALDQLVQQHVQRATDTHRKLEELQCQTEQLRLLSIEAERELANATQQRVGLYNKLEQWRSQYEQQSVSLRTLEKQCAAQATELSQHETTEANWLIESQGHEAALQNVEQRLSQVRRELARADKHYRQLEARLTRTRERIAVLSEIEDRLHGLTGGVQEAIQFLSANQESKGCQVHGIVADLLRVDVDTAPLVEMILGERAQFVVVSSSDELAAHLARWPMIIGNRVGFLSLEAHCATSPLDHVDLSGEPGVMGRADRFVEHAPAFDAFVKRLLGRTWLVDHISTALRLAASSGRGLSFVTSDGELLGADGTIIIGPRQPTAGILTRRSELRACQEQVAELERQLVRQSAIHKKLDVERVTQEKNVASTVAAYTAAAGKLAECRRTTADARILLERTTDACRRVRDDMAQIQERIQAAEHELDVLNQSEAACSNRHNQHAAELAALEPRLAALRSNATEHDEAVTNRRIAFAKCEERVELLRRQVESHAHGDQQHDQAVVSTRARLAERQSQRCDLNQLVLSTRQELAELYLHKERCAAELADELLATRELRRQRAVVGDQMHDLRQQSGVLQSQVHKIEVTLSRLHHERETLCERMLDDYGIDLEAAAKSETDQDKSADAPPKRREAVEQEIAELRHQVNNIGSINLTALDELEQLEARFEMLSGQYRDLVEAKVALERIIQRINIDSRQVFLKTLEMVRGHFQELFRRLFGGGEADIIVDDAEDILESGIEIVARPPGKEACSISLLSGGEKTLTCVALLLAVFRSKPSPFCILDEVDAALDEANIGRFIGVLREFLSFTQFVVVTHSKKTMAGGDTLYGVTMEESGVSKRVSVRFEDVSETGEIRPAALVESGNDSQSEESTAADSRRAA